MDRKVKSASTTIFILSGLVALSGLIYYGILDEDQHPLAELVQNLISCRDLSWVGLLVQKAAFGCNNLCAHIIYHGTAHCNYSESSKYYKRNNC